jgi:paraquat-inducible protein B
MTKANPKLVGAFVVGGVALLLGGILTFGSMQFLKSRLPAVMYFEEELTGLDPGAPVTFRGVQIGTVTDVVIRYNVEAKAFRIPVYVQIEPDRFSIEGTRRPMLGDNLSLFVEQGLRAQLATQSILTGKRLVELAFHPGAPVRLTGLDRDRAEIPTIPSQMEALQAGIENALKKLEQTPIPELVDDLRTTVRDIGAAVRQVDAARFSVLADDASETLRSGRALLDEVRQRVDAMAPAGEAAVKRTDQLIQELHKAATRLGPALASVQRTAERADHFLETANGVIEPGSVTHREMMAMLKEITAAARSMRTLADELDRNPNSLLFGKASPRGR